MNTGIFSCFSRLATFEVGVKDKSRSEFILTIDKLNSWFNFSDLNSGIKIRSDKVKVEGTESKYMSTKEMGDCDGEN